VPYIFANTTVAAGATLTVEPGVEARFREATELRVYGQLTAIGTAEAPILFTGAFAESETPQPGWWYGVTINGIASAPLTDSVLDYVTIEYSGRADYANLNLIYATVAISNSTFRHSASNGIRGQTDGVAHISDSTFTNNAIYPIEFRDGSVNPILANLTVTNNGVDAIFFGNGTIGEDRTWRALGVPYIFANTTVAAGATLTVEPGVEARFAQATELRVNGKLIARGTAEAPILFTGTFTDTVTAAVNEPGWWYGVSLAGIANAPLTDSVLEHVTIESSGRGGYANLNLVYATVVISHSTFSNSSANGILGQTEGVAHISDSTFTNNAIYPIEFRDGSVNPMLANLTVTNNGVDAVVFGSGVREGEHTWRALSVPYIFANVTVATGATLTIEPGVEARFEEGTELRVNGRLIAIGLEGQPIRFTGAFSDTAAAPGWWYGISVNGTAANAATAQFEHVIIEYSGRSDYANLTVLYGQVVVHSSLIHRSSSHGIQASGNSVLTVERSQIVDNGGYGIRNIGSGEEDVVLAANNWWGSSSGPTADGNCNVGGTGSRVSEGVAFQPFLKAVDEEPGPIAPADTLILTLTPERWFAPANGVARIRVTITLRNGEGTPLPGRTVTMASSLGTAVSGVATNALGQSMAYVTSDIPGDAELLASLDRKACEMARSASAHVTFTELSDEAQLLESEAPYFSSGIEIDPEPIIRGVPTRLSAKLTNPNDFPITVDATFEFVQSGIGLVFGPAGEVLDQIIPPHSEVEIAVMWTPVVDGHYCVQLIYTAERAGLTAGEVNAPLQGGSAQRNLNIYPGPMGSPNEKDSLDKADQAFKFVNKIPSGPTQIQKGILSRWWGWMKNTTSTISKSLGGDPPRQDYRSIPSPTLLNLPPDQPGGEISAARAAAINAVTEAFDAMNSNGLAAAITLDRYGGAAAANNLEWSSLQAASLIYYKEEMGQALLTAAQRLDELLQVVISEGDTSVMVTADEIRAYQDRLRTSGYTAEEISDAKTAGLTDADIEASRQDAIAADPEETAGDLIVMLTELANEYRNLGNTLLNPPNFTLSLGGSGGLTAAQAGGEPDNLARIFSAVNTIQVGNPLGETATVELEVRRVDLPSDWMVTVSPISVTLAPGEQVSATVTIIPGASAVQGSTQRVAIEGYAGNQLLGGVVMDVLVPKYMEFDGNLDVFLPLVEQK
jgi:hypothetical protein